MENETKLAEIQSMIRWLEAKVKKGLIIDYEGDEIKMIDCGPDGYKEPVRGRDFEECVKQLRGKTFHQVNDGEVFQYYGDDYIRTGPRKGKRIKDGLEWTF